MENRTEKDAFGKVVIPTDRMWGAQTQRSLENFPIGIEKMPKELIKAYALIKKAAALANAEVKKLDQNKAKAIQNACNQILAGEWQEEFPLSIWQTGSGTQTNMNMNEVISQIINQNSSYEYLHPNDDINLGQSTNDTFPSAMHIAGILEIHHQLLPVLNEVKVTLETLEKRYVGTIKLGRTHLQDATPITFAQEISGWREMVQQNIDFIEQVLPSLLVLPLGGTAVGTGLNAHPDFSKRAINYIAKWTGLPFQESLNKFHGLSSKDAIVQVHGALKTLAINVMKIANDIRWLASGPRGGFGEITIPANEPGSSIMPGKINPTQVEALTMVCTQVIGNDTTISIAASQGNFELNAYMPVISYNFLQSIRLLSDSLNSFNKRCLKGLEANEEKMLADVKKSLSLATALTPHIGYEKASIIAQKAEQEGLTLREAAIQSKIISAEDFDEYIDLSKMI